MASTGATDVSRSESKPQHLSPARFVERWVWLLVVFELLLGVAHVLWPEFKWGQGRRSYFYFPNGLTLASWLTSIQLALIALAALVARSRERASERIAHGFVWVAGALLMVALSIAEITRFHHRFGLVNRPESDPFAVLAVHGLWLLGLALGAWFVLARVGASRASRRFALAWLAAWLIGFVVRTVSHFRDVDRVWGELPIGLGYLLGSTFLLAAILGHGLRAGGQDESDSATDHRETRALSPRWAYAGIFGMTFTIIFVQVLLQRLLSIFGDYLTAQSVISIALLGISIGGLLGFLASTREPFAVMAGASLLLPIALVMSLGAVAAYGADPIATSILLTVPFALSSTVITVALALGHSHRVYFVDLLGAAAGALVVAFVFEPLREESGVLALAAFAFLASLCFVMMLEARRARTILVAVALVGIAVASWSAIANTRSGWLNVVHHKVLDKYPKARIMYSASSFVGRFDVIQRRKQATSFSTYENGQITDNIRQWTYDNYAIDPRIPDDLIDDPVILVLGTSGDGVLKTARFHGKKVYGVEINPVVVAAHMGPLRELNKGNYDEIDVSIVDGRSYVENSPRQFDMITLMNVHMSRGRTTGRAPSPEYLHTREAVLTYLDRLTDHGILNVEEVNSNPQRTPPIWKLLWTMRSALLERGVTEPWRHFFVFQWRTRNNNYLQILLKKTPFTGAELGRLRAWLDRCDRREELEDRAGPGVILGPITTKTTLLHAPDEFTENNASLLIRGEVSDAFREARLLDVTTDDRPFHFDVDPRRRALRSAYSKTLLLLLLLAPFFVVILMRHRDDFARGLSSLQIVALTGIAFFLLEVVLIQRYTIYLGSPTVTFTTVLGTLLLFSGLGSLWSGKLGSARAIQSVVVVLALVLLHLFSMPAVFRLTSSLPLAFKALVGVGSIAPLAFFMGVPFPYVMRQGQGRFGSSSAAMLFAINGAASALAVPLAMSLASAWGFGGVMLTSFVTYGVVALLLMPERWRRLATPANAVALVLIGWLVMSPWTLVWGSDVHAGDDRWRVFALNYGNSKFKQSSVYHDGSKNRTEEFHWWFWLIRGHGRTILVDTGSEDEAEAQAFSIRDYRRPSDALRGFGVDPSEVTDVIVTHAHWDHIGGLDQYPNARVHIQNAEIEHAMATVSPDTPKKSGMRWRHIEHLRDRIEGGDVVRLDGRQEIFSGITVQRGGGHTPGAQWVEVETIDGTLFLTGDATYRHENNVWHRPIGSTRGADPEENLAAILDMQRRAASTFLIIAGHEPKYLRWFPSVGDRVVELTTVPEWEAP